MTSIFPAFGRVVALLLICWLATIAAAQEIRSPEEVVATINGESVTREMLASYNNEEQTGISTQQILTLSAPELKPVVQSLAVVREAARRGLESNRLPEEALQGAEQAEKSVLINLLYQRVIIQEETPPSEEAIGEYYEANNAAFTTPMTFSIRHIFCSTYVPYETQEGDTFESIARDISGGNTDSIERILIDTENKPPRAEGYTTGNREHIKPLEAGEMLLVPGSTNFVQEKEEKIEAAWQRLESGDAFTSVAVDLSENAMKGAMLKNLTLSGRPMLSAIVEAVENTPEGAYSKPFKTKHGFNIIQVVEKKPETTRPLGEVRDQIVQRLTQIHRQEMAQEFLEEMYQIPELEINLAVIKNPELSTSTIAARLGEETYTRGDFLFPKLGETSKEMSDEDAMVLVKANPKLRQDILVFVAREKNLEETDTFQARMDQSARKILSDAWFALRRQDLQRNFLSQAQAKKYFLAHPNDFVYPPTYSFYLLAIPIEEGNILAAFNRAQALTDQARTSDAFAKMSTEQGQQLDIMDERAMVRNIRSTQIQQQWPELYKELALARPGSRIDPLKDGGYVLSAWVLDKQEAKVPEYDEVKDMLPQMAKRVQLEVFPRDLIAEILDEVKINILGE